MTLTAFKPTKREPGAERPAAAAGRWRQQGSPHLSPRAPTRCRLSCILRLCAAVPRRHEQPQQRWGRRAALAVWSRPVRRPLLPRPLPTCREHDAINVCAARGRPATPGGASSALWVMSHVCQKHKTSEGRAAAARPRKGAATGGAASKARGWHACLWRAPTGGAAANVPPPTSLPLSPTHVQTHNVSLAHSPPR